MSRVWQLVVMIISGHFPLILWWTSSDRVGMSSIRHANDKSVTINQVIYRHILLIPCKCCTVLLTQAGILQIHFHSDTGQINYIRSVCVGSPLQDVGRSGLVQLRCNIIVTCAWKLVFDRLNLSFLLMMMTMMIMMTMTTITSCHNADLKTIYSLC